MSNTKNIIKRDGAIQSFDIEKITQAIYKAMLSVDKGNLDDAKFVAQNVLLHLEKDNNPEEKYPSVEKIQDIVEQELMKKEFYDVAKSYILYRQQRAEMRKRDIFKKRTNLKPYEYPELYEYVSAIRHSYWIHTEFNFTSDIQDFKVNVNEKERNAIKNVRSL